MVHRSLTIAARSIIVALLLFAVRPAWLLAQEPYTIIDHYNKHEYMIPMRDGVKLFTAVYTPKDTTQNYPIILNRTPYSSAPYGENLYPPFVGPQAEKFYR